MKKVALFLVVSGCASDPCLKEASFLLTEGQISTCFEGRAKDFCATHGGIEKTEVTTDGLYDEVQCIDGYTLQIQR